jgi:hypothetical protein
MCTLDLHLDWVVFQLDVANALIWCEDRSYFKNFVSQVETSYNSSPLFVHSMHFEYPMFYSHCNHESNVMVIPSTMGTCQGDPLGRALFILTHFRA